MDTPWWQRLLSFAGLAVMVALAWAASTDRRAFPWRIVVWGTCLQLGFGVFVLRTVVGRGVFSVLNGAFVQLLSFTQAGSRFVFGAYFDSEFTVALHVLPTIVFFSSLMAVLYHLGWMQRVVHVFAVAMRWTLKTSGPETLSAAANIFVGQTEAPLMVKPFIRTMTESELMALMVGGFASVAGGVLAAYVGMLQARIPEIAGHLLAASVMSAPAALLIAKVLLPETHPRVDKADLESAERGAIAEAEPEETLYANLIDAAAAGAADGLKLALNIGAMLISFIALVALLNWLISLPAVLHNFWVWRDAEQALRTAGIEAPVCGALADANVLASCIAQANQLGIEPRAAMEPWSIQQILGWLFWPVSLFMGVPPDDCAAVASLMGQKLVLNEFVAYSSLLDDLSGPNPMSERAALIASYSLCGFANFSSIAIQIGGISAIAPERRADLARLGLRAMYGGMLAANMTACVAGILL